MIETPSDADEIEPALTSIPEHIGVADRVLADAGYVNADAIERVRHNGTEVYVAITPITGIVGMTTVR